MNDTPTPTPRTEKVWKKGGGLHSMDFHARTLERELTAVTEQRDRLAEALIGFMKFCGINTTGEIPAKAYPSPLAKKGIEALQSLNQPTP